MNSIDPKSVALSFLGHMRTQEFAAAYALFADHAVVWNSLAGSINKSQFMVLCAETIEKCKSGWNTTVLGITAEGGRVAVEAEGFMELADDRIYDNQYHLLFETDPSGKIILLKEYMDTAKAIEFFGPL